MINRRTFLVKSGAVVTGSLVLPSWIRDVSYKKVENIGVQLYTFRKEMETDAIGTLKIIAELGFKEIETARPRYALIAANSD